MCFNYGATHENAPYHDVASKKRKTWALHFHLRGFAWQLFFV
jgi:hypothetical protein